MKELHLDKYYTPLDIASTCIEVMKETLLPLMDITEYVEPSAGNGSFSLQIPNCLAYDLEPEHSSIMQADFLKLNLPYKKGRIVFGNPPFGKRNKLARSFYKKSVEIADAIAFILPISQMNNTSSLYEFDLIKSIDLGKLKYSNTPVHCCFNIYTRPSNFIFNSKPKTNIEWIKIYREDQKGYDSVEYDFAITRRGSQVGKIRKQNIHTQTYKIKVFDKTKVETVRDIITSFNWDEYRKYNSAPSISKLDIYTLLQNKMGM